MWGDKFLDLIFEKNYSNSWSEKAKGAWKTIFGQAEGRYPGSAESKFQVRAPAPAEGKEGVVPFAAFLNPANPESGPYGGMSIAIFPGENRRLAYPCREETWLSLREHTRLFHRAVVPTAHRTVDLMLTAFPLSTRILDDVVDETTKQIVKT